MASDVTEDVRDTYAVWPDNTVALYADVQAGEYGFMSDDYLVVSLTEEQADIMTYDEMARAIAKGKTDAERQ